MLMIRKHRFEVHHLTGQVPDVMVQKAAICAVAASLCRPSSCVVCAHVLIQPSTSCTGVRLAQCGQSEPVKGQVAVPQTVPLQSVLDASTVGQHWQQSV